MTKEQEIATHIQRDNSNSRASAIYSAIAKYIPSIHQVAKATNYILKGKYGSIDTQDGRLKNACQVAWRMSNEGKTEKDIFKAIYNPRDLLHVNARVMSEDYGSGYVVHVYSDNDLMRVQFENNKLPIMCSISKMKTVHKSKDKDNCKIWVG